MDDADTFSPGRTVDIDLGTAEVITIDLDNLDPNPDDVLDLLKDGQCKDWVWTKLAGEYWRKGYLDGAERIALAAVECMCISISLRAYSVLVQLSRRMVLLHLFRQSTVFWLTSRSPVQGQHQSTFCPMLVCETTPHRCNDSFLVQDRIS